MLEDAPHRGRLAQHNIFTQRPSDPVGCDVCRRAKLDQKPARRVAFDDALRADRPLDRVHVDTIGPLWDGARNFRFILVARDEYSGWVAAVPMFSKTSREVVNAFFCGFVPDGVRTIRADPGLEIGGAFERVLADRGIVLERSILPRTHSHSRAERYHRELDGVVRSYLCQSGLLYSF